MEKTGLAIQLLQDQDHQPFSPEGTPGLSVGGSGVLLVERRPISDIVRCVSIYVKNIL
jgi:hypothetical protein